MVRSPLRSRRHLECASLLRRLHVLVKELEEIVSLQFDLIVKRKELAYEDMNKKLEELKKEIEQRKTEVEKWKTEDFKNEQVIAEIEGVLS